MIALKWLKRKEKHKPEKSEKRQFLSCISNDETNESHAMESERNTCVMLGTNLIFVYFFRFFYKPERFC